MSYLQDFQKQLENQNFSAALTLWDEYCQGETLDVAETLEILTLIKRSEKPLFFGLYMEKILPLWKKVPDSPQKDRILALIFDLQTTNSQDLWELARTEIERRFGGTDHFGEKFRIAGLRSKEALQGVISHFEFLDHLKKGNFVFHPKGWGVGEILDFSLLREELSVEFDYLPGKKDISFATAFKTLEVIPNDHFLAQRFGQPDLLEEKAKTDPVGVIHLLLKDLGPKTASEIKDELCDLVIPENEWAKWWQTTRSKLKKDTLIDAPANLKEPFRLRKSEVSHEDKFQKLLEKNPTPSALIQSAYSFLKDFPESTKNEAFRSSLEAKIVSTLSSKQITPAEELQLYYLLQMVSPEKEGDAIVKLISQIQNINDVLDQISILSFKKKTLSEIKKQKEDWKQSFLQLLLTVDQNPVRETLFNELMESGAEIEVKKKLEELCAQPSHYPEAFLWYFQKIMGKETKLPYGDVEGKMRFFESLLILLSHLEHASGSKEMMKKIYQILLEDRYALVRAIFQKSSLAACQEFLLLSTKCQTFSDHDIKILHSLAEVAHPSLAKKKKTAELHPEVIWTTQAGYLKTQDKLKHLATVEVVQNAKEIEVARGHGDLRENAEFKAALEKRDRLQSEIKTLSDQINRAQVITPDDIFLEQVGIGSVISCSNKKGDKATFTLLGPWDADPEKNILSFQSKLAQSMVGRKVGDSFQAQGEEYTITAIQSYLG